MDTSQMLITFATLWTLAFILITAFVVFAYLFEFKQIKKFENLKKLLQGRGDLQKWESANSSLIQTEKVIYGLWIFSFFSIQVFFIFFEHKNEILQSILLIILLLLSIINIVVKRFLYFKLTNFVDKSNG